jgi:hypothetical protein
MTAWGRVTFDRLIVADRVKKFSMFYRNCTFVTASEEPDTDLYPEPAKSNPYSNVIIKIVFNIIVTSASPPQW